jgi:hypothetical protein
VAPPPTATRTSTTVSTTALTTATTTPTTCPFVGRDLQDRQQANACPGSGCLPFWSFSLIHSSSTVPQEPAPQPTPKETRVPVATMTFNYEYLRTKQTKKGMGPDKQKLREDAVDQVRYPTIVHSTLRLTILRNSCLIACAKVVFPFPVIFICAAYLFF